MYSSDSVVPMRPKGQRPERRQAPRPKTSGRRLANSEAEVASATLRLPVILFRKHKKATLVVELSKFTLERLANDADIVFDERQAELRLNLLDVLEGDGLVDPGVVRRREDRLLIIEQAMEACIKSGDVEHFVRKCRVTYKLSASQMKRQKRAFKEHKLAQSARREERVGQRLQA